MHQGIVFLFLDQTYVADTGINHIGQAEVDQSVLGSKGECGQRPLVDQSFFQSQVGF